MVPNFWEYGWGAAGDNVDTIMLEEDVTLKFHQAENMTYFGKVLLVEQGAAPLSAWEADLDVELSGSSVSLSWTGVDENMEYQLLKSVNGYDFHLIDSGVGVKQNGSIQEFQDKDLSSSKLYYKLRVFDNSEQYWDTEIQSVSIPVLDEVSFYPNVLRSGDQVRVDIGETEDVRWKLYDLEGRLIKEVYQDAPSQDYMISQPAGQYVVEISTKTISKTSFLIVQ